MWSLELSQGLEVRKCRHRIVSYLKGVGLDLGCANEKVCPQAIGIDIAGEAAQMAIDLSLPEALKIFSNDYFDYVFSSHCLEDLYDIKGALSEWWRVIRYGGYLILYGPDPDYYPRIGTAGANPNHKRDLHWQDVWKIIEKFGNAKLISATRHNESNEYSWLLVCQKKVSLLRRPFELLFKPNGYKSLVFPRKKVTNKECLIVRLGALGDAVWVTPALRELKKQGYHIVYNCTEYSAQVLRECPYIDEFLIQPKDVIPIDELGEYWKEIGQGFEKVVNFSGSVEGSLLKLEGTDAFDWPHNKRHMECNVNYIDKTMEVAGFPKMKGQLPELHFTELEEYMVRSFRHALKDYFLIEWSLCGSSFHKHYPWTPFIVGEIAKNHDDVRIVMVGDTDCQKIEPRGKNVIPKAGVITVRDAMLLTKYADLVIGPETGILNAASCYNTPKIVFLSHSSEENLTKYWQNCTSLKPENCKCHPCHKLIYTNSCPKEILKIPNPEGKGMLDVEVVRCAHNIRAETVYKAFLKHYKRWKDDRPKNN